MPTVLAVKEVADYLRCHESTVYAMLRAGTIPAFRVGGDWRFRLDVIERWTRGE